MVAFRSARQARFTSIKSGISHFCFGAAVAAIGLSLAPMTANAVVAPSTTTIVSATNGSNAATVSQASNTAGGTTTTINAQGKGNTLNNYQSFGLGTNDVANILQDSASNVAIERVTGNFRSDILGKLTSEKGRVVIINPNGVIIGTNGSVSATSFLATTANLDSDKISGKSQFNFSKAGNANAQIINNGTIKVSDTGLASLVAPTVTNNGTITAKMGKIQLAGADTMTFDFDGRGLFNIAVKTTASGTPEKNYRGRTVSATNNGSLIAEGGLVQMSAASMSNLVSSAINNDGIIEAKGLTGNGGTVELIADNGTVAAGNIDVSSTAGDGGTVSVSGKKITANKTINADGSENGGHVLLSSYDPLGNGSSTINGTVSARGGKTGGQVMVSSTGSDTTIGSSSLIDVSGGVTGGTALVNSSYGDVKTGGTINANGGTQGGSAIVSADYGSYENTGSMSANGGTTGGTLLVGGTDSSLKLGGTLSATGETGGNIAAVAQGGWYANPTLNVTGTVNASGTKQGGKVIAYAENGTLKVASTATLSANGGTNGGEIAVNAPTSNVEIGGTLLANGATGKGGKISVTGNNAAIKVVNGASLQAKGATAGGTIIIGGTHSSISSSAPIPSATAELSESVVADSKPSSKTGGEFDADQASTTTIEKGAVLNADATGNGNGGSIFVWSKDKTSVAGSFSARGGSEGGVGGTVDTSSDGLVKVASTTTVDTRAKDGKNIGNWTVTSPARTVIDAKDVNAFASFVSATAISNTNSSVKIHSDISIKVADNIDISNPNANLVLEAGLVPTGACSYLCSIKLPNGFVAGTGDITMNDAYIRTVGGDVLMSSGNTIALNNATIYLKGLNGGDGGSLSMTSGDISAKNTKIYARANTVSIEALKKSGTGSLFGHSYTYPITGGTVTLDNTWVDTTGFARVANTGAHPSTYTTVTPDDSDVTFIGTNTFDKSLAGGNIIVMGDKVKYKNVCLSAGGVCTIADPRAKTNATISALVNGVANATAVYGDVADPTSTVTGLLAGDSVMGNLTNNFSTFGGYVNVGSYTVSASGMTIDGVGNYNVTYNNASLQVTPKQITVSIAADNKVYDATTAATARITGVNSFLTSDVSAVLNGASFATPNVGNGILVTGNISLTGAMAGNYTIVSPTTTTADITAAVPASTLTSLRINPLDRPVLSIPNNVLVPNNNFKPLEVATLDTNVSLRANQPASSAAAFNNIAPAAGGDMSPEQLNAMAPAAGGNAGGDAGLACANSFLDNKSCGTVQ